MKYPGLFWLVVLVSVLAFVMGYTIRYRRRRRLPVGWVANTGYVRELKEFKSRLGSVRRALIGLLISAILLASVLAILGGKPVHRMAEDKITASRDIVLCLDASGSMIGVDADIMDSFVQLVHAFNGERVALVIWNQTSRVVFPLTDDYQMVEEQLEYGAQVMRNGVVSKDEAAGVIYVTQKLSDYLVGVQSLGDINSSSLVGDGLANCALSFDERKSERSRSIILATDNQEEGKPAYTLQEAIDLTKKRGITVNALYSADYDPSGGLYRSDLKKRIEAAGGKFFDASDESSIDGIIRDIESQQKHELLDNVPVKESDETENFATTLMLFLLVLISIGAVTRL